MRAETLTDLPTDFHDGVASLRAHYANAAVEHGAGGVMARGIDVMVAAHAHMYREKRRIRGAAASKDEMRQDVVEGCAALLAALTSTYAINFGDGSHEAAAGMLMSALGILVSGGLTVEIEDRVNIEVAQ